MTAPVVAAAAAEVAAATAEQLTGTARPGPGHAILAAGLSAGTTSAPGLVDVATAHVRAAVAAVPAGPGNLHHGVAAAAGAALVVHATTHDPRLVPVVRPATMWLSRHAVRIACRYHAGGPGPEVSDYDAVSGLAGLGRMLLLALRCGHTTAEPGLRVALDALTHLLAPGDPARPAWWRPRSGPPRFGPDHPSGTALTAMAHGVAGPLALLAIAHAAGVTVDGQADAIRATADRLCRWRSPATGAWPSALTGDQLQGRAPWPDPPVRHQWCVGTAGIAHALHLAGRALADPGLVTTAVSALAGIRDTPPDRWGVRGPALCCGYAGVLRTALASWDLCRDPGVAEVAHLAAAEVIARRTPGGDTGNLLDGTPGVVLALHDYASRFSTAPASDGFSAAPTSDGDEVWPAILLLR